MTIPLMSEFFSCPEGNTGTKRQDCKRKAFTQLATRLHDEFGHRPIMLLLDALYPTNPIMEPCCKNRWDFMIVLLDKTLTSVWEEYEGLAKK